MVCCGLPEPGFGLGLGFEFESGSWMGEKKSECENVMSLPSWRLELVVVD